MSIPLNIDLQQILLHLFNFMILAVGLYVILYKPVKNFMDSRQAHYKEMDQLAEEKLSKAEGLRNTYQKQLDEAETQIAQQKVQAVKEAQVQAENELQEARRKADQILEKARADARDEHDRMIAQTREEIVDLAAEATEKLMRQTLAAAEGNEAHEG